MLWSFVDRVYHEKRGDATLVFWGFVNGEDVYCWVKLFADSVCFVFVFSEVIKSNVTLLFVAITVTCPDFHC